MNPLPSHFRKLLISQNISLCEKSRVKQILLTEKTHKNTLKNPAQSNGNAEIDGLSHDFSLHTCFYMS